MSDSLLGKRVRLSPLGIKARIITRGATTGEIRGIKINGEPTRLLILRDGLKYPAWYDASFWQPDDPQNKS